MYMWTDDSQTNITYVKVRYVRLSVARKNAKMQTNN